MKFISSRNNSRLFSLKEAIYHGLAPDGGLFMPAKYPPLSLRDFKKMDNITFTELAYILAKPYLDEDFGDDTIKDIVNSAFDFDIPLKKINGDIYSLELFHGPTLAFKDVGARFMARLMTELNHEDQQFEADLLKLGHNLLVVAFQQQCQPVAHPSRVNSVFRPAFKVKKAQPLIRTCQGNEFRDLIRTKDFEHQVDFLERQAGHELSTVLNLKQQHRFLFGIDPAQVLQLRGQSQAAKFQHGKIGSFRRQIH